MKYDFGLEACYESVVFLVEELHEDPIRLLGQYIIRRKQDPFFNPLMIEAVERYIEKHDIRWDS